MRGHRRLDKRSASENHFRLKNSATLCVIVHFRSTERQTPISRRSFKDGRSHLQIEHFELFIISAHHPIATLTVGIHYASI